MLEKRKIGILVIIALFVCFLSFDSANAANEALNNSDYNDKVSDSNNSNIAFEEYEGDPLFIDNRGTFPKTINQEWENSINRCWLSLTKNAPSYTIDSSIKTIGTNGEFIIANLGSD
ncbi:hypothetical protein [Methanococcoides burtonii]|uniref:hypothetical protein n=1 Tax=Methanococcoides burtonii TaxID=29291 RepID=UPI0000540BFE|nr:hypothetical protein [Methanococcoides burtonii]